MMQPCFRCPEWAQWQMRRPTRTVTRQKIWGEKGIVLAPDGNPAWETVEVKGWELVAVLCATHKQEQEKLPENEGLRFDFIGAAPMVN